MNDTNFNLFALAFFAGLVVWAAVFYFTRSPEQKLSKYEWTRVYCAKHTSTDWQYRVCVEGDEESSCP